MWQQLDPRTKLAAILTIAIIASASLTAAVLGVTTLALLALWSVARAPLAAFKRLLPAMALFMLFTLALNLLFHRDSNPLAYDIFGLTIYHSALVKGALYCGRIAILCALAIFFAHSLRQEEFAELVWRLLQPLGRVGLPVQAFGMALALAIRFIPEIERQYQRVKTAQIVRGADFGGNPVARVRRYVPILAPVMVGALRRSSILADALAVRGWELRPRTFYREYRFGWPDGLFLCLTALLILLTVVLSR